jgi:hypothetical protein
MLAMLSFRLRYFGGEASFQDVKASHQMQQNGPATNRPTVPASQPVPGGFPARLQRTESG